MRLLSTVIQVTYSPTPTTNSQPSRTSTAVDAQPIAALTAAAALECAADVQDVVGEDRTWEAVCSQVRGRGRRPRRSGRNATRVLSEASSSRSTPSRPSRRRVCSTTRVSEWSASGDRPAARTVSWRTAGLRSGAASSCLCTETACSAAARTTSSYSPEMVSVQLLSLGNSRQSATVRVMIHSFPVAPGPGHDSLAPRANFPLDPSCTTRGPI